MIISDAKIILNKSYLHLYIWLHFLIKIFNLVI